jgi:hypothetical protein
MGIEPTTSCLEGKSSTVELRPHLLRLQVHQDEGRFKSPFRVRLTPMIPPVKTSLPLYPLVVLPSLEWVGRDSNPRRTSSARFTVWCN